MDGLAITKTLKELAPNMLRPRLLLALVPIVLLAAFLIVGPLATQGASPAQPVPAEVVSDAPVCVRFYPATGETREGPEICNTRAGDPPPAVPAAQASPAATGPARERRQASSGLGSWVRGLVGG